MSQDDRPDLAAAVAAADERRLALREELAGRHADLPLRYRAEIVNVAGAVGVPAIDGMTLDYPVADTQLDRAANQQRFLERMALVYGDAVRARAFGMSGKWVGHPLHLFAVLLAGRVAHEPAALDAEAGKLEAYQAAVGEEGRGATIIGGVMSDRATDRHARGVLRQATALGRFDADRALALGVIDETEHGEARRWAGAGAKE